MTVKDDAIPTGVEIPVDQVDETKTDTIDAQKGDKDQEKSTQQDSERKFADRYNSVEELETAHKDMKSAFSRQGSELGELRKTVGVLEQGLADLKPKEEAGPSIDDQYAELEQQLDSGNINVAEFAAQSRELDKQVREVEFGEREQTRTADEQANRFLDDNPLYSELEDAGELDTYIQANPILDRVSAYYAIKGEREAAGHATALEAARAEGKAEGLALAKGSEGAKAVISKTGVTQPQKTGPVSSQERQGRMLGALKRAREA